MKYDLNFPGDQLANQLIIKRISIVANDGKLVKMSSALLVYTTVKGRKCLKCCEELVHWEKFEIDLVNHSAFNVQ